MKQKVYCSFCKLPQKVYKSKHIGVFVILALTVVGAVFTYLVWQDFHWTGVVLFLILAVTAEMVAQMRWRMSIRCSACGFDPVVYKRNPQVAADAVKAFLAERKKDPLYLLKPQPDIRPIIKKVKDYKWTEPPV